MPAPGRRGRPKVVSGEPAFGFRSIPDFMPKDSSGCLVLKEAYCQDSPLLRQDEAEPRLPRQRVLLHRRILGDHRKFERYFEELPQWQSMEFHRALKEYRATYIGSLFTLNRLTNI